MTSAHGTEGLSSDRVSRSRRADIRADAIWMVVLASLAIGYFGVLIAFNTTFFFPVQHGATIAASAVWSTAALLVAQVAFLPLRRRRPVILYGAVVGVLLIAEVVAGDRNLVVNPTLLFAVWNLCLRTRVATWLSAVAVGIIIDCAVQLAMFSVYGPILPYSAFAVVLRTIISFSIAAPAGLLARSLQRASQLAGAVAAALEREEEARIAAAVANERTRMARELHDVAAYHLSGIVLQASAVKEVLTTNPATADSLVDSIRLESELTVQSLREVIGVLRAADSDHAEVAPSPRLPTLIDQLRTAHPEVGFAVDGALDDVPPATALASFRIVQESLTNARKHAPGSSIEVKLVRDRASLSVSIRNGASTDEPDHALRTGGGFGLVGMRERTHILGGDLITEETADGGWITRATMPIGGLE